MWPSISLNPSLSLLLTVPQFSHLKIKGYQARLPFKVTPRSENIDLVFLISVKWHQQAPKSQESSGNPLSLNQIQRNKWFYLCHFVSCSSWFCLNITSTSSVKPTLTLPYLLALQGAALLLQDPPTPVSPGFSWVNWLGRLPTSLAYLPERHPWHTVNNEWRNERKKENV